VSNPESGVPIGKLIDTRHELSALIKANLYDYTGGNKNEGRAALIARQSLDKFILNTPPISGDAETVRETYISATTLEMTLGELCDILDTYYAKSNSRAKAAMGYLVADKDALFRFDPQSQHAIDKIAHGSEWFANRRFKRLHESIRRGGIPYMK
jgi:hypothetical protein